MSLKTMMVIGEGATDASAFASALSRAPELLAGRIRFEYIDPTTIFPSDHHAAVRAEDFFGVQPQEGVVSAAGVGMNTLFALKITSRVGVKRLLFFGLRRI